MDATPAQLDAYRFALQALMARQAFDFMRFWFSIVSVAFVVALGLTLAHPDRYHWAIPTSSAGLDFGIAFAMRQVYRHLFPDPTKLKPNSAGSS